MKSMLFILILALSGCALQDDTDALYDRLDALIDTDTDTDTNIDTDTDENTTETKTFTDTDTDTETDT